MENPYIAVGAKLMDLLREAKRPNADFTAIARKVRAADVGLRFPDYLPVSHAKFAVEGCLGPRKISSRKYDEALSKISSCEHAAAQYYEKDRVTLKPEYADLKIRIDESY